MRIVAGTARGRRIITVEGTDVRPTMDRVREAVFNSLASHDLVDGCTFVDLFAGTGALGLEALSRGAAAVTFVDRDRRAIATIDANLTAIGLGRGTGGSGGDESAGVADVRLGDALRVLPGLAHHDVALLDPPYEFDGWADLIATIDADALVIESDRPIDPGEGWETLKEKRYAGTVVTIAVRSEPRPSARAGAGAHEEHQP